MAARSKARRRALEVLFECEVRGLPLGQTLPDRVEARVQAGEAPLNAYTETLVTGVAVHQERIDELIAAHAEGWSLARMPAVDRNALRIGVLELLWVDDVPDAVAVSEAVAMVRELSTDESPGFVNGVLGTILRDKGDKGDKGDEGGSGDARDADG